MGINWDLDLENGETQSFSWENKIDTPGFTVTGGQTFKGSSVNGTVATISDSNTSTTASDYTATVDWGDGTSDANATPRDRTAASPSPTSTRTRPRARTRSP